MGRRDGCMPFPRALVRMEAQVASFRISTRVIDSNANNNNYYFKGASGYVMVSKLD